MGHAIILILMALSSQVMAGETILDCRISRIALAQAFGDTVALKGSASEVMLYSSKRNALYAKLGNYANFDSNIPKEIVTHYDLSDKDIVYLSKFRSQEMIILSIAKKRNSFGLRPGRIVLQRGADQRIAAYVQCR